MPELIDWDCPQCGETNTDLTYQYTHCAKCGRVVMVSGEDGDFFDEGYNIEIEPAPNEAN